MAQDSHISTSVIVIGGGLVGLSAAVFLASKNVPVVVVERHAASSLHPRAIGYTQRTMELYRTVGMEERIPQHKGHGKPRRVRVESLAGNWFEETYWTDKEKTSSPPMHQQPPKESTSTPRLEAPRVDYSPCGPAALSQDRLEPLLRDRARELGADICLETTLLSFQQDADEVTAIVRGRDGKQSTISAAYLIAADGHRSLVRESLCIARTGAGHMRTVRSILFHAPLDEYLEAGISQFNIEQPDFDAFLTTYRDGRWVLMLTDDEKYTAETMPKLVYRALGREDLEVGIITTGRWEMSALIADTFSQGRVFLAGDAAHMLPPNRGGYGANTGIEDAHNLAWKLSAVLSGSSQPCLLDTYDAERRPVAWLRHDQIFARGDFKVISKGVTAFDSAGAGKPDSKQDDIPVIDDSAMELGQLYRSAAVLGAASSLPPALKPDEWAGQPGTRAPHLWLARTRTHGADDRLSTLDLFGGSDWVLLGEDAQWRSTVEQVTKSTKVPLRFVSVCAAADAARGCSGGEMVWPLGEIEEWRRVFGVGPGDVALVRPDGYIAWRGIKLHWKKGREEELVTALRQVAALNR